ncbi:774_t:CDS:1, partial [Gigaspora rosea]
ITIPGCRVVSSWEENRALCELQFLNHGPYYEKKNGEIINPLAITSISALLFWDI